MATPTQALAEVFVLRKMAKKRMEDMKSRRENFVVKDATHPHPDNTSYDEKNDDKEIGCFSWIHKKVHPSSLSTATAQS